MLFHSVVILVITLKNQYYDLRRMTKTPEVRMHLSCWC